MLLPAMLSAKMETAVGNLASIVCCSASCLNGGNVIFV